MESSKTGAKYEATRNLSRVEVAKLIRADIKAAIKTGALPPTKYSVTCKTYSMGGSIDVEIGDLFLGRADENALILAVEAIVDAYNFERNDYNSDSFRSKFHSSVRVDHSTRPKGWGACSDHTDCIKHPELAEECASARKQARANEARDGLQVLPAFFEPTSQETYLDFLGA